MLINDGNEETVVVIRWRWASRDGDDGSNGSGGVGGGDAW